jgi:sigma-B regulation protein RsbU (phosphoserine phosphatase)
MQDDQTLPQPATILVVDDILANQKLLRETLEPEGYEVLLASEGVTAIEVAQGALPDIILLDVQMPGIDGFETCRRLKQDKDTRNIPVLFITANDDAESLTTGFRAGAVDFVTKPFRRDEVLVRIETHLKIHRLSRSLAEKNGALQVSLGQTEEAFAALQKSQQRLAAELAEAAAYVRSLLPAPLTGPIETEWCFNPGEQLGGDAFGYHWIDENHFAIYLLDVCGHGVGAALLSVSVLNTLRAQNLSGVDFRQPASVLAALNRTFQMDNQNQLYFTIWFGVYRRQSRELVYASGGHPPALLFGANGSTAPALAALRTPSPAIGCLEDPRFLETVHPVAPSARLLVLSDGIFEILRANGQTGTWDEFVASFNSPEVVALRPPDRLRRAQQQRGGEVLEDDFSLMEFRFH